jgi:hypothetical protein
MGTTPAGGAGAGAGVIGWAGATGGGGCTGGACGAFGGPAAGGAAPTPIASGEINGGVALAPKF